MNELSPEARAFLDRAVREEKPPSAPARRRVKHAVLSTVAAGATAGATVGAASVAQAAGTGATAAGAAGAGGALAAKSVVGWVVGGFAMGLVGATAIGAGVRLASSEASPAVADGARDRPQPSWPEAHGRQATSRPDDSAHQPTPEPARAARRATARQVVGADAPVDEPSDPERPGASPAQIAEDVRLLKQVQIALRENRADDALELLRSSPQADSGPLREERLASEVFALCKLGRRDEARAAAKRFLSLSPNSPLAPRVGASCAFGRSGPQSDSAQRIAEPGNTQY